MQRKKNKKRRTELRNKLHIKKKNQKVSYIRAAAVKDKVEVTSELRAREKHSAKHDEDEPRR